MTKYLLKRLLHGLVSLVIVVAIVMVLIYSCLNRDLIFAADPTFSHQANNQKVTYKYRKWAEYGYLDYVTYGDYINSLYRKGEIDEETRSAVISFARKESGDSEEVKAYVDRFRAEYEAMGYQVVRLDAVMMNAKKLASGGTQQLFAHKDIPLSTRIWKYFTGLISVDNIHYVQEDIENRGLTFTLHDPLYGGEKFSPAILGNGTKNKYLLYCSNQFPYVHQNLLSINLGKSYSVRQGIDVFTTMVQTQGSYQLRPTVFPTGLAENSADDLHSATYAYGSREGNQVLQDRFTDDYTSVLTVNGGKSKIGYSFTLGIFSVLLAYLLGVPLGIVMARHKDGLVDRIGTLYIVFIIAVPSLAYIFMFKAIGGKLGMPVTFDMDSSDWRMYVMPVISLALPSVASLMKWLRRYMIDQMNADYVKFARSSGLSEGEIFRKHILKNAAIPIIHGIPGSVLGALVGSIITERVYVVPGAGNLLTQAINRYDNGVIVGVTLFYGLLSVISIILGDILMATVDPRISFTSKAR